MTERKRERERESRRERKRVTEREREKFSNVLLSGGEESISLLHLFMSVFFFYFVVFYI